MLHEIDEHLENHVDAEVDVSFNETQLKLFSICNVWKKVRPVIKFARGLLFWRPKWQAVIDEFIAVADGICPQE